MELKLPPTTECVGKESGWEEQRGRHTVCRGRWGQTSALLLPDVVTDFDFSPFDQLLLATGSADETVSAQEQGSQGDTS